MATISAKEFLGGRPATLVGNENTPDYKRNTLQSHPTFGQNVSSAIQRRGENVYGAIAGTSPESQGESPLVRGVQATGEAFGAITDVGAEAVKSAVGLIPQGARDTATNIKEGLLARVPQKVKEIGAKAYEEVGLQLDELSQENPEMASKVESALKVGKGAGEIAGGILVAEETATGLTKGGKLLEKGAQKAKDVVSDVGGVAMDKLGNTPEKIMQRVARISKGKQAKFQQKAGESVGEYLTKRKIFGDVDGISEQLYKRFNNSKATADSALEKLPGVYKPPQVGSALQELLDREVKVSAVGAPSPDIARVSSLVDKYEKAGLTMSEINEVKRLFERNVKLDFLRQNLPQGVAKANNIDNAIRSWQVNQAKTLGLKNLPEINRETLLAKQLLDDLGKEYAGSAGNNAITLTDWIMLSGGDPTAIAGFLTKKTFSSKNVQSKIAELFSRNKESMGEIGADIGESQVKQLGAPAMGQAQKGVEVPIEMPSRKAIESGTEIVPRQSILDRDITPESVKNFETGLREDVSDYIKNPKLGMSIEDVTKNNPLLQEAKKYKSAEYAMSHRPSKTGAIASDISKGGEVIPKDVYEHPEWYANMKDKTYQESFAALKKIKGKPEAEITIYRSSPKNELNEGDWVTLSKTYADEEGLKEGVKTYSYKVKAKDIQFAGDDINEFGYYPNK